MVQQLGQMMVLQELEVKVVQRFPTQDDCDFPKKLMRMDQEVQEAACSYWSLLLWVSYSCCADYPVVIVK